MPGEPPVRLEHRVNTETYFENLSRRRFLSFLFGYMSFLTLVLYVVGYVYLITDRYWLANAAPLWRPTIFRIFWCIYVFALANLLSISLLGLFYLTDRIHRPNRIAHWGIKRIRNAHREVLAVRQPSVLRHYPSYLTGLECHESHLHWPSLSIPCWF